eukprot:CAMPEP_0117529842 /NCGR_PEP_ID=MMETSP0784-20121206/38039_1 /TAXON_ID=39447 /ORGANISM="" /LENGTH=39 /DNA_ID= /DNA_START= /DNA_END= /DNA_ORIENTATION=
MTAPEAPLLLSQLLAFVSQPCQLGLHGLDLCEAGVLQHL